MQPHSKFIKKKYKVSQDLSVPLRPNHGQSLSLWTTFLGFSGILLTSATSYAQQNKAEQSYSFNLDGIITHGGESLNSTAFYHNLKTQYMNKPITLVDIKNIKDSIANFYTTLDIKNVKISIRLPKWGMSDLNIIIKEPKINRQTALKFPTIKAINFTGEVTVKAEGVLALADQYVGKPYTFVNMMNLKKQLKKYYAQTSLLTPLISLPEFEEETGEVYLDITEIHKEAPKESVESVEPVGSLIEMIKEEVSQPLFEVSRGVFLKKIAPIGWQEPKQEKQINKPIQKKLKAPLQIKKYKKIQKQKNAPSIVPPISKKELIKKINSAQSTAQKAPSPFGENEYAPPTYTKISDNLTLIDRSDDDLLILELSIDGQTRSQGISAYLDYNSDSLYIPISELAEALSFPLEVTPEKGLVTGFFADPKNTFVLDMNHKTLTIKGEKKKFPTVGLEASHDDIYATPELLKTWFPVDIALQYAEQRLEVTSQLELPFQAYAKRRNIWQQVKDNKNIKEIMAPTTVLERQIFSKPTVYTSVNSTVSRSKNDQISSNSIINLQASADVLQMAGHISANVIHKSGQSIKMNNIKTTLTKLDPQAKMLGVLGATQIEMGDVDFQSQPLLSATSAGRGLFISNKSVNAIRDSENFTIKGNAPIGWDVEVYQNGQLLDFQTVANDGTYTFSFIPLEAGRNVFDIKIYGPNGERNSYTEEFYLGQGVIKKGEFNYDFIATQSSAFLISTESDPTNNEDDGILSFNAEYGLFKKLSIAAGLYNGSLSGINKKENALTLGLRTGLFGTDIQGDFLTQSNDTKSYQAILRKRLNRLTDFSLTYLKNENYTLEENETLEEKSFALNQGLEFKYTPDIQLRLKWKNRKKLVGITQNEIETKISTQIYGINLTNDLNAVLSEDKKTDSYNGSLSLSGRFDKFDVRGRVNYNLKNNAGLSQISARINGKIKKNINSTLNISQIFNNGATLATYDSSLSWRLPKVDFGLTLGGDTDGTVRAGINLASYYLPSGTGYSFKNSDDAAFGAVQINLRAFIDDNQNETYDKGEELLENAVFLYRTRGKIARTNKDGIATLTGLNPFSNNLISFDLMSLEDIYLKPVNATINIIGRPYQHGSIDFPLKLEGEVSGMITYHAKGAERPLSGMTLTLVNTLDKVVSTSISEFDGYYIFPNVPMGDLTLNMSEDDLSTLDGHLNITKPKTITLSKVTPFIDDQNIEIYSKEETVKDTINNSLQNMVHEKLQNKAIILQSK